MIRLYSYWRSSASHRVRIALHYKNLSYETITVDLPAKEHKTDGYTSINHQGRIPTLTDGNFTISQSLAIIEYLEEKYPDKPLMPKAVEDRATARSVSQIITSDLHPLNNSGTLNYLKSEFQPSKEQIMAWYHHWLKEGYDALEKIISEHSNGLFCINDQLSIADLCLIPQIYNSLKVDFDMSMYPTLMKIYKHCSQLDYFENAKPEIQPGYKP